MYIYLNLSQLCHYNINEPEYHIILTIKMNRDTRDTIKHMQIAVITTCKKQFCLESDIVSLLVVSYVVTFSILELRHHKYAKKVWAIVLIILGNDHGRNKSVLSNYRPLRTVSLKHTMNV